MKIVARIRAKLKLLYYRKKNDSNIFAFYEDYLEWSGILTKETTSKFVIFISVMWWLALGSVLEIADSIGK